MNKLQNSLNYFDVWSKDRILGLGGDAPQGAVLIGMLCLDVFDDVVRVHYKDKSTVIKEGMQCEQ